MSWINQCRAAFLAHANSLLAKKKGSREQILKELSRQSGIPKTVLEKWWNKKTPSNKICIQCKREPVFLNPETGRPLLKTSKAYGLCGKCRSNLLAKK